MKRELIEEIYLYLEGLLSVIIISSIILTVLVISADNGRSITYEQIKSHSVKLYAVVGDRSGVGTGTVIKRTKKNDYILTNDHVCPDKSECYIVTEDGYKRVYLVKRSDDVDLAIFKIAEHLENKVPVNGFATPVISEDVFLVGSHQGNTNIYAEGVVAGVIDNSLFVQIPIFFGNSGSAIFNESGEVIAVVNAMSVRNIPLPVYIITHSIAIQGSDVIYFVEGVDYV